MKLISARVQNYKLVDDSGEFSVRDLTCLAGKNESGKTALMEALRRLNPVEGASERNYNPLHEYPRKWYIPQREYSDPVLNTEWELCDEDIAEIEAALGEGAVADPIVTVSRGYSNRQNVGIQIANTDAVRAMRLRKNEDGTPAEDPEQVARNIVVKQLPKFLYFPNYGTLPGKVSIDQVINGNYEPEDAEKHKYFAALLDLAGTSVQGLSDTSQSEELIAQMEAVSIRISDKVFQYWSQNRHLQVEVRCAHARPNDPPPYNTGEIVELRVRNDRHRVTTPFDARSAGFVWFFSFLVWFYQMEKTHGSNLVILLDEPGLSLHAAAQADLLRYIRTELLPKYQVIYTTHSPFMVDTADLMSVRTVEDTTSSDGTPIGTKVGDKVLSTDSATLFPLRAALGYDITQSLFIGENCLLVEGPSDLIYLQWASQQLAAKDRAKLDDRWTIVPAGGISKIGTFASLFASNHLNVCILTDFHEGDKRHVRELEQHKMLSDDRVFTVPQFAGKPEADTEDLLGWNLYRKVINRCFGLKKEKKLPKEQPNGNDGRVEEATKAHFQTVATEGREFDHLSPAVHLLTNAGQFAEHSGTATALDNFEQLFRSLNRMLDA